MKNKNVECKFCGSKNWSGELYCEKCSGDLFHNQNAQKSAAKFDQINSLFKLWK
ncbi:hypothetical protein [Halanaerobium praevalens]|uniref:Uncharacterized protein n=1 Tax=Halanaerobium praevalens (strain ATCC 33744 / DSM 2228 / GSL) TaxID=572479 RepID=E3DPL3_HALPG|nr:hypothetical protein [Halanaerobium praevalens]ADO77775.1 hypothetical protein Hprae_1649 [Halanaerobium praevalens DSM 2228]